MGILAGLGGGGGKILGALTSAAGGGGTGIFALGGGGAGTLPGAGISADNVFGASTPEGGETLSRAVSPFCDDGLGVRRGGREMRTVSFLGSFDSAIGRNARVEFQICQKASGLSLLK